MKCKVRMLAAFFAAAFFVATAPAGCIAAETAGQNSLLQAEDEETGRIYAKGPGGRFSVKVPGNWDCRVYSQKNEDMFLFEYGLRLTPAEAERGYIDFGYSPSFGVCGTGLTEETMTFGGREAHVGTYDGQPVWNFVIFPAPDDRTSLVALSNMTDTWTQEMGDQGLAILDTLIFEPEITQGGIGFFQRDSEVTAVGVLTEVSKVSDTGIILTMMQYDRCNTGELYFGDDFSIQRKTESEQGEEWEEVPALTEEYAFNDEAYSISPTGERSEWTVDWEGLYGKLSPGEYRVRKTIFDGRAPGDYDAYDIFAHFRLMGEPYEDLDL